MIRFTYIMQAISVAGFVVAISFGIAAFLAGDRVWLQLLLNTLAMGINFFTFGVIRGTERINREARA